MEEKCPFFRDIIRCFSVFISFDCLKESNKTFLFKTDFATFIGYNVVSVPFFSKTNYKNSLPHNLRLEEYYNTGRMLVKMAEALGRISLAGRELTKLAGYTERVDQLMAVLNDLNKGHYQRSMVTTDSMGQGEPKSIQIASDASSKAILKPNSGKIVYKDNIIK